MSEVLSKTKKKGICRIVIDNTEREIKKLSLIIWEKLVTVAGA